MPRLFPCCFVAAVLALSPGCTGNGLQFRFGPDGAEQVTARTKHDELRSQLQAALSRQLPAPWTLQVDVLELPYYDSDDRDTSDGWWWERLTCRVTLLGPPEAELPDTLALEALVSDLALHRVYNRPSRLRVVFVRAEAASPSAPENTPAPSQEGKAADHGSSQREGWYTVQDGDTLALIATVFYGNAAHWRHIVSANPELNPEAPLEPGTRLRLPPLP